jgi:hypothetical protein
MLVLPALDYISGIIGPLAVSRGPPCLVVWWLLRLRHPARSSVVGRGITPFRIIRRLTRSWTAGGFVLPAAATPTGIDKGISL